MLCQILKFVLPRVPLSIEHRRDIRPGHIVVDAGLNMIADGRSRGRNFGRGLLNRRNAPVAGRTDREDEGQTRDCQTEQLPFDSHVSLSSVFLDPQLVTGIAGQESFDLYSSYPTIAAVPVKIQATNESNGTRRTRDNAFHIASI